MMILLLLFSLSLCSSSNCLVIFILFCTFVTSSRTLVNFESTSLLTISDQRVEVDSWAVAC